MDRDDREQYRKEAEKNIVIGYASSMRDAKWMLAICAAVLTGWLVASLHYDISDALTVSGTIALSTISIIWTINRRTAALEADVIYVGGAVEWFGDRILETRRFDQHGC